MGRENVSVNLTFFPGEQEGWKGHQRHSLNEHWLWHVEAVFEIKTTSKSARKKGKADLERKIRSRLHGRHVADEGKKLTPRKCSVICGSCEPVTFSWNTWLAKQPRVSRHSLQMSVPNLNIAVRNFTASAHQASLLCKNGVIYGIKASASILLPHQYWWNNRFQSQLGLTFSGFSIWCSSEITVEGILQIPQFPPLIHKLMISIDKQEINAISTLWKIIAVLSICTIGLNCRPVYPPEKI